MDCSQQGSSVHGILQARILEWVATSFCRGSSWPRDWTRDFWGSYIGRQILYHWATWEALHKKYISLKQHRNLHRGGIFEVTVFILILSHFGYISDWHGITLKEMGIIAFSHIFFIFFFTREPLRYTYFKYLLFTTTRILNSCFISQWSLISTQRTTYCAFIVSAVCQTFITSKGTFFLFRR